MNYLAHIFLSGSNRKVQLGNFVGDAVKGSSYKNYPPDIAKGIQLHRAIDDYTDHHPAVCEVVHRLQPEFGLRQAGKLRLENIQWNKLEQGEQQGRVHHLGTGKGEAEYGKLIPQGTSYQ